jgi:hypothetical protein
MRGKVLQNLVYTMFSKVVMRKLAGISAFPYVPSWKDGQVVAIQLQALKIEVILQPVLRSSVEAQELRIRVPDAPFTPLYELFHSLGRTVHRIKNEEVADAVHHLFEPYDDHGVTWALEVDWRLEGKLHFLPIRDRGALEVRLNVVEEPFMRVCVL